MLRLYCAPHPSRPPFVKDSGSGRAQSTINHPALHIELQLLFWCSHNTISLPLVRVVRQAWEHIILFIGIRHAINGIVFA